MNKLMLKLLKGWLEATIQYHRERRLVSAETEEYRKGIIRGLKDVLEYLDDDD